MNQHAERAKELFNQGYNCSQSVFAAFCEDLGIDFDTALKLSSSFGGGMGKLREVCGGVSGMFMVAGMKYGYTNPNDDEAKANHYKLVQELAFEFKEKNKSIICRELLGLEKDLDGYMPAARTAQYYESRPCVELVGDAAKIMSEYMNRKLTT